MAINLYSQLIDDIHACSGEQTWAYDDILAALPDKTFVRHYFVRPQTVFDRDSVYESISCYVVTDREFIVVNVDVTYEFAATGDLMTSVHHVPLEMVRDFQVLRRRSLDRERKGDVSGVAMQIRWGSSWSTDTLPASCDDPTCQADHGYMARTAGDDCEIVVDEKAMEKETFDKGLAFIGALETILSWERQ